MLFYLKKETFGRWINIDILIIIASVMHAGKPNTLPLDAGHITCVWSVMHAGKPTLSPWMLVIWPVMHAGKPTPPPPCWQTNTCANITLPQTSFVGGNKLWFHFK